MPQLDVLQENSVPSQLDTLIATLRAAHSGEISSDEGRRSVAQLDWVDLDCVGEVYSYLDHYWSDSDIREKDEEYARFQENELSKLIAHLENRDFESAIAVSFLHVSAEPKRQNKSDMATPRKPSD